MKILICASKTIEVEVPEDIDPDEVQEFISNKIREEYLGAWNFDAWAEIKPEATSPYKECHQNDAEIISMGKCWQKCRDAEAEIFMKQ
jgi:hypothetical protein